MPRFSRRKRFGRRRRGRRSRKMLKLYRNPSTGTLGCKQKTFTDILIPTLAQGLSSSNLLIFSLAPVQNNFPQCFDQFRINYVKCTFWSVNANPGSTVNNKNVILYTSVDLDGQNPPPTTEPAMLERSNVKQRVISFGGGNPVFHTHGVKPRTASAIYNGPVSSGYGFGRRKQWLDIRSSIDSPHYGMLWMISAPEGIGAFTLRVQFTYYLQFRKVI